MQRVKNNIKKVTLYNALLCPVSKALRYDPCIQPDHTVLPGTRTRTIPAFAPQPPVVTALWLVLSSAL